MGMKKLAALVMALVLCRTAVGVMAATEVNSVAGLKTAIEDGATDIIITATELTFGNKEEITITTGNVKLSAKPGVMIITNGDDPFTVTGGSWLRCDPQDPSELIMKHNQQKNEGPLVPQNGS